jgi:hypothetical protein
MTLVSTVTVGSGGAASINFSSIPQTATDLLVLLSGRSTSTTSAIRVNLNGSATGFSERVLQGDGGTALSFTETTFIGHIPRSDHTSSTFGSLALYIPNYAGSSNKSFSVDAATENNATTAYADIIAGVWSNTSAITQVTLTASNFAQYSSASLYLITKGSGGATAS